MKIEIKHRITGTVLFAGEYESWRLAAEAAVRSGANLSGAMIDGKAIHSLRIFTGLLYPYPVWSVLCADGSRWVRMGCLFHSLDDWEKIGIRQSNVREFPDDGSAKSQQRVAAFEFAAAAALRMALAEGEAK